MRSEACLSDKHAHAVNLLVSRHLAARPQSTLLSQAVGGFSPVETESVQVLYDANHWVTSAVVAGRVLLAYSINQAKTPGLVRQLRQLYAHALTSAGRETKKRGRKAKSRLCVP